MVATEGNGVGSAPPSGENPTDESRPDQMAKGRIV
jgi:hypothetical protein